MNVNPVSFSSTNNTTGATFHEKINRPQAYISKDSPSAATNINGNGEKEKTFGSKLLKTVAALAIVLAGLGISAKKGLLNPRKNETINKIKAPWKQAGDFVADKASVAAKKVQSIFKKNGDDAAAAAKAPTPEPAADPASIIE